MGGDRRLRYRSDRSMTLAGCASVYKYNPDYEDQARVPAGNPDGGQWTEEGGESEGSGDRK
jgi:hypothetical protein